MLAAKCSCGGVAARYQTQTQQQRSQPWAKCAAPCLSRRWSRQSASSNSFVKNGLNFSSSFSSSGGNGSKGGAGRRALRCQAVVSVDKDEQQQQKTTNSLHEYNSATASPTAATVTPEGFSSIEEALQVVAKGGYVVVVDDENRENEGDLIAAAELVSTESMAFLLQHTSGIVCVGLTVERCAELELPLMVEQQGNSDSMGTAFTVTVDAREGTTTGISASDRATTVRRLGDNVAAVPEDFNRPGHIFPLRCREGGVLVRPGHTEAAADLSRLAGCSGAGVLCELMNADGSVQRLPQLREFAAEHKLPLISIDQLVEYRRANGV